MQSNYKGQEMVNGKPNNGMVDRRIFTVGGLSALLAACAGPLTKADVPQEYHQHVQSMDKQPASIKFTEAVNDYLGGSKELPRRPEAMSYDTNKARAVLSAEEKDTLDRVVAASTYIKLLDENRALPHLYVEYLQQISNEDLSKVFTGYSQTIANDSKDYIGRIERELDGGRIRSKVKDLREKIEKLNGPVKNELKAVMADFDAKTEGLQNALTYLMAAGRNFGNYDGRFYDAYANIEMARTGIDPHELGDTVMQREGIALSLEQIAKDGTSYDVRKATHIMRKKVTDAFIAGRLTPADYVAGEFRIISAEKSTANTVKPESGISILDALPVIGLVTGIINHAGQVGGYEGIDTTKLEDIGFLVMADYAGVTPEAINMQANENRAAIAIGIGSTLAAIGIGYAIGAATSSKGSSSKGVASKPMGSSPVVEAAGRGARTGGAGVGSR